MSTLCALCNNKPKSGKLAACEQLIASPLSGYVVPKQDVLRCAQCTRQTAKHATQPLCKACFKKVTETHVPITAADMKRGWMLVTREKRGEAGFEDPSPVAMAQPGDMAKIPLFALPSPQRIEVEAVWMNEIRAESEEGWYTGAIHNDLVLFDPTTLKLGQRVRFQGDHVVQSKLSVQLPNRKDGHACKLCDATVGPPRIPDERSARAIETIRKTGWFVMGVGSDEGKPPFAYTLGLYHSFGLHDLLLSGMAPSEAANVLNRLVLNRPAAGWPFGVPIDDVFEDARAMLIELADSPDTRGMMTWTRWFEDRPSPCAQLIWSDRNGYFPWDETCDETLFERQELLAPQE